MRAITRVLGERGRAGVVTWQLVALYLLSVSQVCGSPATGNIISMWSTNLSDGSCVDCLLMLFYLLLMLLAVNVLIPYKNTMAMHVWAGDSERKHLLNDIDII